MGKREEMGRDESSAERKNKEEDAEGREGRRRRRKWEKRKKRKFRIFSKEKYEDLGYL